MIGLCTRHARPVRSDRLRPTRTHTPALRGSCRPANALGATSDRCLPCHRRRRAATHVQVPPEVVDGRHWPAMTRRRYQRQRTTQPTAGRKPAVGAGRALVRQLGRMQPFKCAWSSAPVSYLSRLGAPPSPTHPHPLDAPSPPIRLSRPELPDPPWRFRAHPTNKTSETPLPLQTVCGDLRPS